MRPLIGESQILWQYREVFQLLTVSHRCFEHLELLFGQLRLLSDDFVLPQDYLVSYRCQSIDIDGRGSQYLSKHWLDDFSSTDALIFVVPLSSYCENEPTSTTPLVSEMYAF